METLNAVELWYPDDQKTNSGHMHVFSLMVMSRATGALCLVVLALCGRLATAQQVPCPPTQYRCVCVYN